MSLNVILNLSLIDGTCQIWIKLGQARAIIPKGAKIAFTPWVYSRVIDAEYDGIAKRDYDILC